MKEDKVKVWRARLDYARRRRDLFFKGQGTDDDGLRIGAPGANFAMEVFRGNSRPPWWNPEDAWIHIGKLKAAIRSAVPMLLYKDPQFQVYPVAVDVEQGADVAYDRSMAKALWLRHWWKESHGTQHARIGIQNAFFNIGCAKAGYRCHFQDDESRGVFARDEDGNYILDENGDPTLDRGQYATDEDGEILRDAEGFPQLHPGTVCKEEWFVEVVDCRNMLFDVDSGPDFFQHRYVIEEWVRPLSEVKDDPRFSKARRDRLTATETRGGAVSHRKTESPGLMLSPSMINSAVEEDEAMVRGYDIYDFQNDEYLVLPECGVGENNEEFLLEGPMPPGMEHGPFRFLKYTEDVGAEWYPVPDATDMAIVNQEYNITRSQMMIHREHTKTRYEVMDGTFTGDGISAEEEMAKLSHGPDAAFVRVSRQGGIQPVNKAPLDNSFFQAVPNIAADFNEVGGMPGEMRGISDADTATQASIMATGAEIRADDRRDNQVQTWLQEIGRVLLMSAQANADLDTVVMEKVAEQTGVLPFKPIRLTREELVGEFEVNVAMGSTMQTNSPQSLLRVTQMLTALGQNPGLGMYRGLMRRMVEGLNLDPSLVDEIEKVSQELLAQQNGETQAPTSPQMAGGQQILEQFLPNGTMNPSGGVGTGGSVN